MPSSRINLASNFALLLAVVSLVVGTFAIAACAPAPGSIPDRVAPAATPAGGLDLAQLGACLDRDLRPVEDGSMSVYGYPCVWDSASMGIVTGYERVRWVLYVEGVCPMTVQPAADVECIDTRTWLTS